MTNTKHNAADSSRIRLSDDTMVTARDGRQHSWRTIKLLLTTLIVSTLGDGFCGVMMSVALPDISETFHISLASANWVTVGYAIVAATAVMAAPALLAKWGLKKLFSFSRVILIGSCAIGFFSVNFPMLLASRLVQAIASGIMFPTINTVIIRVVPANVSGRILSLNSAIIGLGMAVAPLISGLFLSYVSLTSMYVIPLLIGILSLIMGIKFIFDVEARKDNKIDIPSVILAFAGLAFLMLGISEITHQTLPACLLIAGGAGIIIWFGHRQMRIVQPLLNIQPLIKHSFVAGGVTQYILGGMGQQAILLLLPLFLERACGYSDAVSGAFLIITTVIYSGGTLIAGKIVDKKGLWPIMSVGFFMLAACMLAMYGTAQYKIALLMAVIGGLGAAGYAFINVPVKDVVMELLPDSQTADISAIFSTCFQIASSIGSALFVGILSAQVLRMTDAHTATSVAYADGFQSSIIIGVIIEAASMLLSIWYSRKMVKRRINKH